MLFHAALSFAVFCQAPQPEEARQRISALSAELETAQSRLNELKNRIGEKVAEITRLRKQIEPPVCILDPALMAAKEAGRVLPEALPRLELPSEERRRLSDLFWRDTPAFQKEIRAKIGQLPSEVPQAANPAPARPRPRPADPLAAEAQDLAGRLQESVASLSSCEKTLQEHDAEFTRLRGEVEKLEKPAPRSAVETRIRREAELRRRVLPEGLAALRQSLSPQKLAELETLLWQDPAGLTEALNRLASPAGK
ncbi:MAG: hypothetical protein RL095_902 [Verrucomicrobiota bacterium]|jgi:septal ring factor EnvC (AmiA/AmiB activator)